MTKTKKRPEPTPVVPQPEVPKPKRRRRRRRRTNQLLSQRLVTEVNQKKRQFLRDVSGMLTDALGFEVRVTLVAPKVALSADMRRAARMTKAQASRQIADSFNAPIVPGSPGPALLTEMLNAPFKRHRAAKAKRVDSLSDPLPI